MSRKLLIVLVSAISLSAADIAINNVMPTASHFTFISRYVAEETATNAETSLLHDIASGSDIPSLCKRINGYQDTKRHSVFNQSQRYDVQLSSDIDSTDLKDIFFNRNLHQERLSPFMIAALRGNKQLLDCVIRKRGDNNYWLLMSELMLADKLARLGFAHPLAAILDVQPNLLQSIAGGLNDLIRYHPLYQRSHMDAQEHYMQQYWFGNASTRFAAHALLLNFSVSENGFHGIARAIAERTCQGIFEHQPYVIGQILQEIDNHLIRYNLAPTFGNVAALVLTQEFKEHAQQIHEDARFAHDSARISITSVQDLQSFALHQLTLDMRIGQNDIVPIMQELERRFITAHQFVLPRVIQHWINQIIAQRNPQQPIVELSLKQRELIELHTLQDVEPRFFTRHSAASLRQRDRNPFNQSRVTDRFNLVQSLCHWEQNNLPLERFDALLCDGDLLLAEQLTASKKHAIEFARKRGAAPSSITQIRAISEQYVEIATLLSILSQEPPRPYRPGLLQRFFRRFSCLGY